MSIWGTLSRQFPADKAKDAHLAPHLAAFTKMRDLSSALAGRREQAQRLGTLNEKGITETVRTFAAASVVPELRRQQYRIERRAQALQEKRMRLGVPKPDPADVAGAMLRAEIRTYLRGLEPAKLTAMLSVDLDAMVVAAVFEAPGFLTGVSPDLRARVEEMVIENTNPEQVALIDEELEALRTLAMAVELSVKEVKTEAGFTGETKVFDRWMEEASAPIEREIRAGHNRLGTVDLDLVVEQIRMLDRDQRFAVSEAALDFDISAAPTERPPFNPKLVA
jgi:hypothetical protein